MLINPTQISYLIITNFIFEREKCVNSDKQKTIEYEDDILANCCFTRH